MTEETKFTQADLDKAKADAHAAGRAEGLEAGKAEGHAAGAKAERERIQGIVGCDEAKGREASAQHLAFSTEMSVEAAKGALGGLAKTSSLEERASVTGALPPAGSESPKGDAAAAAASWDGIVDGLNARAGFKSRG